MRQLGGSFGIAGLTTMIHIRQAIHRNNLLDHINPYNSYFTDRFNSYIQAFVSKGKSISDATRMAYGAIDGVINRQSLLLTYNDAYWVVGLVMLLAIPLLFLAPFKKGQKAISGSH